MTNFIIGERVWIDTSQYSRPKGYFGIVEKITPTSRVTVNDKKGATVTFGKN